MDGEGYEGGAGGAVAGINLRPQLLSAGTEQPSQQHHDDHLTISLLSQANAAWHHFAASHFQPAPSSPSQQHHDDHFAISPLTLDNAAWAGCECKGCGDGAGRAKQAIRAWAQGRLPWALRSRASSIMLTNAGL